MPKEVKIKFGELQTRLLSRSLLPWTEHCIECVWPTCYTSCDLYDPRIDGKCQRFRNGIVKVDLEGSVNKYLLKITFKKWGKLLAQGATRQYNLSKAVQKDQKDQLIGKVVRSIPLPKGIKNNVYQKRYGVKNQNAKDSLTNDHDFDHFLMEVYNPSDKSHNATLTIRPEDAEKQKLPFQRLLTLNPGYNRHAVGIQEIISSVSLQENFKVEITPNESKDEITLYFGLMDFVKMRSTDLEEKRIKCVIWDLDNTIWNGVLVEEETQQIYLKTDIKDIIKELDNRGILQSIASKNNESEALSKLKEFDLEKYFLKPQINWEPKSLSIARIAKALNVGVDSFLFIDDQPFEREEVSDAHPDIMTLDAVNYKELLQKPELNFTVSEDARKRRQLYLDEEKREESVEDFEGDYFRFLKNCNLEMIIRKLSADNLDRVNELAQRTNQMNFSGNRYTKEKLQEIMDNPNLDSYVLQVQDKFGDYGIVGFGLVNSSERLLTDLMFSCRIQSKRVEHAFLTFILTKYSQENFYANYNRTERNAPSGKVFEDFGFEQVDKKDNVEKLKFAQSKQILDDELIKLTVE